MNEQSTIIAFSNQQKRMNGCLDGSLSSIEIDLVLQELLWWWRTNPNDYLCQSVCRSIRRDSSIDHSTLDAKCLCIAIGVSFSVPWNLVNWPRMCWCQVPRALPPPPPHCATESSSSSCRSPGDGKSTPRPTCSLYRVQVAVVDARWMMFSSCRCSRICSAQAWITSFPFLFFFVIWCDSEGNK
jgi:hypothetical protein